MGWCRPEKSTPVPATAQRVVLEPAAVAVVTSADDGQRAGGDVVFGREQAGEVALLMRFASPFRESTQIKAAYLVLDVSPSVPPGPAPVRLRLARIVAAWSAETVNWRRLPQLSAVQGTYWASGWAGRQLRLDVTEQVRRWREQRPDDQGLAVLAAPQNPFGASYALGTAGGRGPRLDVYLR
jgi:hypothetical protein